MQERERAREREIGRERGRALKINCFVGFLLTHAPQLHTHTRSPSSRKLHPFIRVAPTIGFPKIRKKNTTQPKDTPNRAVSCHDHHLVAAAEEASNGRQRRKHAAE